MTIFEYAMEKEKYAENYYRDLAEKNVNTGLKYILNMLADEELKHYKVILNMKIETPLFLPEPTLLKDAKSTFEKMKEARETFDFTISTLELYKKAQEFEKKSQEFYLEKLQEFELEKYKEIFKKLAREEEEHYFLLDNIIEFVSRPETWLENAEFNHLEDY